VEERLEASLIYYSGGKPLQGLAFQLIIFLNLK
jgi:hypothetical protein